MSHTCRSTSTACPSPSRPARSPSRPTAPSSSAAAAPWCSPPSSPPRRAMEGQDFFPLTVEYRERAYAGGRIPGGFFKREGAPDEKEILTCRLIDRPIRPLFPKGFRNEIQIISLVDLRRPRERSRRAGDDRRLGRAVRSPASRSTGRSARCGSASSTASSSPTRPRRSMAASQLELVVAGTEDAVLMVEAGAKEVVRGQDARGHRLRPRAVQASWRASRRSSWRKAAKPRWAFDADRRPAIRRSRRGCASWPRAKLAAGAGRSTRSTRAPRPSTRVFEEVCAAVGADETQKGEGPRGTSRRSRSAEVRRHDRGARASAWTAARSTRSGRSRPRWRTCRAPTARRSSRAARPRPWSRPRSAPRTTSRRSRRSRASRTAASCSTTTSRPSRSARCGASARPGRREIGHGALAERAVEAVLPPKEEFPYTIRVVSDILESNGSSSMATRVRRLAGADGRRRADQGAGGRASPWGWSRKATRSAILTDIMGTEDHYGDMDFKVAGTEKGITALQMDIKIAGVSDRHHAPGPRARRARRGCTCWARCARPSRSRATELLPYAPRFVTIKIRPEKIREIIGPGGKVIRGIQEQTGRQDRRRGRRQGDRVLADSARGPEGHRHDPGHLPRGGAGPHLLGKVKKIVEFGAFVEIIPGTEGLLHISQIAESRIRAVEDVLTEGDRCWSRSSRSTATARCGLSPRRSALRDQPALAEQGEARRSLRRPRTATDVTVRRYRKSVAAQRHPARHRADAACPLGGGGRLGGDGLASRARAARRDLPPDRAPGLQGHRHPLARRTIARAMDSVGGQMDAFTTKEHTCFYVQVLDEHLPLAVDLLADILLHPLLRRRGDREREGGRPPGDQDGGGHARRRHPRSLRGAGLGRASAGAARSSGTGSVVQGFDRDTIARLLRATEYVPGADHRSRWPATSTHEQVVDLFAARLRRLRPARDAARGRARPTSRPASTSCRSRSSRCTWCWASRASRTPPPSATRCSCSTTSSAAACRRACSRRCGSGRGWCTRSTPAMQAYRDTGLFYVYAGTEPANFGKVLKSTLKEMRGAQEGRRHRRRAAAGQGPSQGQPDALARVDVQPHEPAGQAGAALRLVPDDRRDARRHRRRAAMHEVEALVQRVLDEEQLALMTLVRSAAKSPPTSCGLREAWVRSLEAAPVIARYTRPEMGAHLERGREVRGLAAGGAGGVRGLRAPGRRFPPTRSAGSGSGRGSTPRASRRSEAASGTT